MFELEGRGQTPCPCGAWFYVTYDRTGRAVGLAHSEPACERFLTLEVTDFLVYVRETVERLN